MSSENGEVESIVEYLERLDRCLSRTAASGQAHTSVSEKKCGLLLRGGELKKQMERNRRLVAAFIAWRSRWFPETIHEHHIALCTMAQLVGFRLLPRGLFREWSYDNSYGVKWVTAPVEPAGIQGGLEGLAMQVLAGQCGEMEERVATIAGIEWEMVVGPLHPFYDGCGRISRAYSRLVADWYKVRAAVHTSREAYFEAARGGREAFRKYYREQVPTG